MGCFWLVGLSFQWLLRFGCFVSTILLPETGHHLQLVLEADQSAASAMFQTPQ